MAQQISSIYEGRVDNERQDIGIRRFLGRNKSHSCFTAGGKAPALKDASRIDLVTTRAVRP